MEPRPADRNQGAFLDWVAVTLPLESSSFDLAVELAGEPELRAGGYLSYKSSARTKFGGLLAWTDSKPRDRLYLSLSSKALAACQTAGRSGLDLLARLRSGGARFRRLDFAMDDYTGAVTVARVYRALVRRRVKTRFRRFSRIVSGDFAATDTESVFAPQGDTVYIGSRQSESFARVYNKAAQVRSLVERGKEDVDDIPDHWTRVEFEFKGKRADLIGNDETALADPARLMLGYLDFKTLPRSAASCRNYNRTETASWWLDFLGVLDGYRVIGLPRDPRALEDVEHWLHEQVAGALALVANTRGTAELEKIAGAGQAKLVRNSEYMRIERQHQESTRPARIAAARAAAVRRGEKQS